MESTRKTIAIFGCGISALSFLYSLAPKDNVFLKIFEEQPCLSNRANTIKIGNNIIDNGANYLCTSDSEILQIITERLETLELTEIEKWVFPFDKNNNIDLDKEKAKPFNIQKKFNYQSGISHLSQLLLKNTKFQSYEIVFNKKITKINQEITKKYSVFSKDENMGEFDDLIFALPTPNAIKILMKSNLFVDEFNFNKILENNQYKTIYALAIGFQTIEDFDFYAIVNTDRKHALSWVSIENNKKGHISEKDTLVLIAQSSNDFSVEMQKKDFNEEKIISEIKNELFNLLPLLKEKKILFENLKKWKYALPCSAIEPEIIQQLNKKRIFFLGDGILGKGRLDFCMKAGISLYKTLYNSDI